VPTPEAIASILEVLRSGLVEPADGPAVIQILEGAARSSSKPGFVDRLIRAQYERLNASMVTFDRAAGRLAGRPSCGSAPSLVAKLLPDAEFAGHAPRLLTQAAALRLGVDTDSDGARGGRLPIP